MSSGRYGIFSIALVCACAVFSGFSFNGCDKFIDPYAENLTEVERTETYATYIEDTKTDKKFARILGKLSTPQSFKHRNKISQYTDFAKNKVIDFEGKQEFIITPIESLLTLFITDISREETLEMARYELIELESVEHKKVPNSFSLITKENIFEGCFLVSFTPSADKYGLLERKSYFNAQGYIKRYEFGEAQGERVLYKLSSKPCEKTKKPF